MIIIIVSAPLPLHEDWNGSRVHVVLFRCSGSFIRRAVMDVVLVSGANGQQNRLSVCPCMEKITQINYLWL